jgi:hypothetical protein
MEKLTYTVTPQEFRQRHKFRTTRILSFLLMGTILLGLTGYGFGRWTGAVICAAILPVLTFYILWYERRKYSKNLDIEMDDWGIRLTRGNKREEHPWSDFSKGMTITDFNRSTNLDYNKANEESDRLTRAAYGEAFILIFKKQPWFRPGIGVRFFAEPNNHRQVRACLERHVKWSAANNIN